MDPQHPFAAGRVFHIRKAFIAPEEISIKLYIYKVLISKIYVHINCFIDCSKSTKFLITCYILAS